MAKRDRVRIEQGLMRSAKQAGARLRRSAVEQLEHWADIGRRFEGIVSHDVMVDVLTGHVRISFEQSAAQPIDPSTVFAELDEDRESGRLESMVTEATVRYQASRSRPGKLERIDADGTVSVGRFQDGRFTEVAADD